MYVPPERETNPVEPGFCEASVLQAPTAIISGVVQKGPLAYADDSSGRIHPCRYARAEEFGRLSQGQHPVTGEQLVRHRAADTFEKANGSTGTTSEYRSWMGRHIFRAKVRLLDRAFGGDVRVRERHRESVGSQGTN